MDSPHAAPALDSTLGAVEIGIAISVFLFGVMCVQAFTYYQSDFKNDPLYVKALVAWCCIAESIHTIFILVYLYEATVKHYGDYAYLSIVKWPLSTSVTISTCVSAPVQTFFTYRVYTLSNKWIYPVISVLASIVRLGLSIMCTVLSEQLKVLSLFSEKYLAPAIFALAIGATVDIANTSALCYYLYQSRGEIHGTRKTIDTLIRWTVETGLITSICITSGVILLGTMSHTTAWLCPLLFAAKLYSNSLLASLNGRILLRAASASTHFSVGTFSPPAKGDSSQGTEVFMNVDRKRGQDSTVVFANPKDIGTSYSESIALPDITSKNSGIAIA